MRRVLWVPIAVFGLLAVATWSSLPEPMATHFDLAGRPNGFSSRAGFFGLGVASLIFMAGLFTGIGALIRRLPTRFINMPHREYWLAPPRRAATLARLDRFMASFGGLVLWFLVAVYGLVVYANLTGAGMDERFMWPLLGALCVGMLALLVWLFRVFPRPPAGG